jgi:hypothetical protein
MPDRTSLTKWLPALLLELAVGCGPAREGSAEEPATHEEPENPPDDGAPPPLAMVSSAFDADIEGWLVAGDAQVEGSEPVFDRKGGNPGGLISARDDEKGGVYYFLASDRYLGDVSDAYGRLLTFDLKTTSAAAPFPAYGVMLAGGGVTVVSMLPHDPVPAGAWVSYTLPLDRSGGWKLVASTDIAAEALFDDAPEPTDSQLRSVLGALELLRIRGEFNDGPDEGSLDNVRFGVAP